MKSEKAKKLTDKSADVLGKYMPEADKKAFTLVMDQIVELAEQEAEERMKKKAIESFKRMCAFKDQRCKKNCKGCSSVKHFIQEMDNNEND